jgi:hypothetical protein
VRDADADPHEPAAQQKLEAPWLGVLRSAAKANGADVEAVYARGDLSHPGRCLGGVGEQGARAIIQAEHASARDEHGNPLPPITEAQIRERLGAARRIDTHLRPLFVAMTAEAIREHPDIADIAALVEHIREKEWERACRRLRAYKDGPGATIDAWARFVCLATMCGGLKDPPGGTDGRPPPGARAVLTEALGMAATLETPDADAYGQGERCALLVSGAHQGEAPPLEPDVLGEGFVLHWLETHERLACPLIDAAWRLGMSDFVRRAAENFPARVEASGLLEPVDGADPAALAAAHTALGVRDLNRGDIAALRARGRRLLTATRDNGTKPLHPPRVRALGAFMWMQGPATEEELAQLSAALDRLLPATDLDAPSRVDLARGLFNAIDHAGEDHARADDLLARLTALAKAHPLDAAVAKQAWKGCFEAFFNSLAPGPPQPRHLVAMVPLLPPLATDGAERGMTRELAAVIRALQTTPEPLASELDAARATLEAAYQTTFGAAP